MTRPRFLVVLLAAGLAACGGGGGGGGFAPDPCSASAEKVFVRDATTEWYLFPELLPSQVSTSQFSSAQELLDYMTATARAQGKDRFFSYVTTRTADNSFLQEGQFVGFGFRVRIDGNRAYFMESFEDSPASDAGIGRGDELVAIDSVPVANVLASDPNLSLAFGPATAGVTRTLEFRPLGQVPTTTAVLTKRIVNIRPVPDDGVAVLALPSNPSVPVGYVNLRTYISTAEAPLRSAFDGFRQQGIQNFVVDLRYNGGGLISIADLMGDLLGGLRQPTDVYSNFRFRASKAANDVTHRFDPQAESVDAVSIAFITTGGSASASELTVNSMKPWANAAIVGADTFGKPVGQSAFDLADACEIRLRLVTFRGTNSDEEGDFYDGLAGTLPGAACAAADDLTHGMGDPDEASTAEALQWLSTGACSSAIAGVTTAQKPSPAVQARYPVPDHPTPAQVHLPGLY